MLWPQRVKLPMGEIDIPTARTFCASLRWRRIQRRRPERCLSCTTTTRWLPSRIATFARAAREAARVPRAVGGRWRAAATLIVTRAAALSESDDAAGCGRLLLPLLDSPPQIRACAGRADNLAWAYFLLDEPALRGSAAWNWSNAACTLRPMA